MDKFSEGLAVKIAAEKGIDPEIVSKAIAFQFKDMLRAATECRKIEMTWFGKFYVSQHKCQRRLFKLRDYERELEKTLNSGKLTSELRISSHTTKLRRIRSTIDFLRSKIDYEIRLEGDPGGKYKRDPCQEGSEVGLPETIRYLQGVQSQLGPSEEV